jgi:hypothetical protein
MKLEFTSINSATITVSASAELYNVSANVSYSNGMVTSIFEGNVTSTANGQNVAGFSSYDATNFSMNFMNADGQECDITLAVKEFMTEVRASQPNYVIE